MLARLKTRAMAICCGDNVCHSNNPNKIGAAIVMTPFAIANHARNFTDLEYAVVMPCCSTFEMRGFTLRDLA